MAPRLKEKYISDIKPKLKARFGIENDHACARLVKIVVNMGVNGAVENKARVEQAAKELGMITGQMPTIRKARVAISAFKLREGMPIGCAVTLRRDRMWEFADRLISIVLPRIRDFRGVKDKLDGRGNYTLGLNEQTVFPEIELDKIDFTQGMDITFVTTASNDEQARFLLKEMGMPFQAAGTEDETKKKKKKKKSASSAAAAGHTATPAPAAAATATAKAE
ncbi:MAG TPA: 50S ribosomal protein L5 [Planctomycetota bacterium]|nr:50S ribosomal protein L5 [Planctomycetota bacterium]